MPEVKDIAIQETPLIPAEVVENASTQSKLLMDIVEKAQCYRQIRDKKYLQVEAWELIGAFNRVHAETKDIKPLVKTEVDDNINFNDNVIGYEAHVQLWRDGHVVGGAIMPCYFTENCCKGKQGDEKHKACMSAAQTFAESKAYRMNYSYVAILAGYQPMPAEEVTEDTPGDGHHDTSTNPVTAIDMGWLRDSLIDLQWSDCGKWIREHYPQAKGASVRAMVESLNQKQQEEFVVEVQKRLEAKTK